MLDASDQPIIALGCDVYAWDGAWQARPALPAGAVHCRLAIDAEDRLFVAYSLPAPDEHSVLHVARLGNDTWEELDAAGIPSSQGYVFVIGKIAFDDAGVPYVAWSEWDTDCVTYGVHRWDELAGTWQRLHPLARAVETCDGSEPRFSLGPDGLALGGYAESYRTAVLVEFDGTDWRDITDARLDRLVAEHGDFWLSRDSSGALIAGSATDGELLLLRRTGARWEWLAADEEVLGGLPPSRRYAVSRASANVHLRHFEQCRWRGLSASDRGGGVSNSLALPVAPLVAVGRSRVCVAWSESHDGDSVGVLRCHALPGER